MNAYNLKDVTACNRNYKLNQHCCGIVTKKQKTFLHKKIITFLHKKLTAETNRLKKTINDKIGFLTKPGLELQINNKHGFREFRNQNWSLMAKI